MKIPSFNSIANVLASVSAVGLAGRVILKAPPVVLQKYPFPFTAVKVAVLIDDVCQSTGLNPD